MEPDLKNVLITGGAGYIGHVLTPRLLDQGYTVTVYDTLYYGARFANNPNLKVVRGDIRDTGTLAAAIEGHDALLYLTCISNDSNSELDEKLSETINYDAFEPMVIAAKRAGVKRFIYTSSSSVYGVSDSPNVTEDHPLVPVTLYNKFKAMCEPQLWKHKSDNFTCVAIRPGTICGYSPRTRFDLTVNIMTNQAVNKRAIAVSGGNQMRPNLHIEDLVDAYLLMLTAPHDKIHGETFNIVSENYSLAETAGIVKRVVEEERPDLGEIKIATTLSNDMRSFHVNSDKIKNALGFEPKHTIEDAIRELTRAFGNHLLPDAIEDDWYYNIRTLKKIRAR